MQEHSAASPAAEGATASPAREGSAHLAANRQAEATERARPLAGPGESPVIARPRAPEPEKKSGFDRVKRIARKAAPWAAAIVVGGGCLIATGGAGSGGCIAAASVAYDATKSITNCPKGKAIASCLVNSAPGAALNLIPV